MWGYYESAYKIRSSCTSWVWHPEELWADPVVKRGLEPELRNGGKGDVSFKRMCMFAFPFLII